MKDLNMWDNLEINDEELLEIEDDDIVVEKSESDEEKKEDLLIEDDEEVGIEETDYSDSPEEKSEKVTKPKVTKPTKQVEKEEPVEAIKAFAQDLKQWDFLPDISDEDLKDIKSPDDLAKILNKQLQTVNEEWQNEFIDSLNKETGGAISHILNGGNIKDFVEVGNSDLKEYSIDDITESEDIQKKIVSDYYKRKGFNEKRITKLVNESLDLEEDAIDFYKEIQEEDKQKFEALKQNTANKKAQEQAFIKQRTEKIKQNVLETKEFIPGRKLTPDVKTKIYDTIPTVLEKINTDLEKYAPMLAYLDYYKLLDGDFSKIIKEETTKGVSALSKVLSSPKGQLSDVDEDASALYEAAKFSVEKFKNKNKKYF